MKEWIAAIHRRMLKKAQWNFANTKKKKIYIKKIQKKLPKQNCKSTKF